MIWFKWKNGEVEVMRVIYSGDEIYALKIINDDRLQMSKMQELERCNKVENSRRWN